MMNHMKRDQEMCRVGYWSGLYLLITSKTNVHSLAFQQHIKYRINQQLHSPTGDFMEYHNHSIVVGTKEDFF